MLAYPFQRTLYHHPTQPAISLRRSGIRLSTLISLSLYLDDLLRPAALEKSTIAPVLVLQLTRSQGPFLLPVVWGTTRLSGRDGRNSGQLEKFPGAVELGKEHAVGSISDVLCQARWCARGRSGGSLVSLVPPRLGARDEAAHGGGGFWVVFDEAAVKAGGGRGRGRRGGERR